MSSNSTKHLNPPITGSETYICSPLFSWKDMFSPSSESTSSEENLANQRPTLPTGGHQKSLISVQPKMENTATIRQVPFRDLSPLAEIGGLGSPHMFEHPFDNTLAHKTTLAPDFAHSLTPSPSSDSETSSSLMQMIEGSPSLSPISPDDTSPPPQKKLKKETPFEPRLHSRSMFHIPNASRLPPIVPSYVARQRENDFMRELNQLPSMFHPAALPNILPGENGEEQLSRASPRLAPSARGEVKKEKYGTRRRCPGSLDDPRDLKRQHGMKKDIAMRNIMSKRQSRKKTNVACTNCVRAKAGCDQGRPCSRCTRLGKPNCVDRPINTRRRRKPARRFVEEQTDCAFNDSCEEVSKYANEFIIGSYNGDADGYIDYYMAQPPTPLSQHSYNPMSSPHSSPSDSAIPPPPLPPIPVLNAMAPNGAVRSHNGILYYGQTTNWASWNPMLDVPPIPLNDTPNSTGSLYASGDIRNQDLSHSPALSAMDISKPSQTRGQTKFETMRPSTPSPKPLSLYHY